MRTKALVRTTAWSLALVLAACAPLSTPPSAAPAPASRWFADDTEAHAASDVASVLRYFAHIDGLRGAELESEYRLAADDLAKSESAVNQLRMALLRSLPGTPFSDFASALGLLESAQQHTPESRTLGDFSHLLRTMVEERMTLDTKRQEAVAKWAERQSLDLVQQRLSHDLDLATRRLRDQQARCDDLEKKIEEVKQIEKSMTERPATAPGRR